MLDDDDDDDGDMMRWMNWRDLTTYQFLCATVAFFPLLK